MEIYPALARPRCVPISELGMQQILSPAAPECNRLPPLSQVVPDFGVLAGAHVRPLLENLRECTLGGNPRRLNICHFSSLPSYHQLLHTPVLRFKLSKMEGEKQGSLLLSSLVTLSVGMSKNSWMTSQPKGQVNKPKPTPPLARK